jgi:hypothetical protein
MFLSSFLWTGGDFVQLCCALSIFDCTIGILYRLYTVNIDTKKQTDKLKQIKEIHQTHDKTTVYLHVVTNNKHIRLHVHYNLYYYNFHKYNFGFIMK